MLGLVEGCTLGEVLGLMLGLVEGSLLDEVLGEVDGDADVGMQ